MSEILAPAAKFFLRHSDCSTVFKKPLKMILKSNKTCKKFEYNEREREIENGSFSPLILSTYGFNPLILSTFFAKTNNSYVETDHHKKRCFYHHQNSFYRIKRKKKKRTESNANCEINIIANILYFLCILTFPLILRVLESFIILIHAFAFHFSPAALTIFCVCGIQNCFCEGAYPITRAHYLLLFVSCIDVVA